MIDHSVVDRIQAARLSLASARGRLAAIKPFISDLPDKAQECYEKALSELDNSRAALNGEDFEAQS